MRIRLTYIIGALLLLALAGGCGGKGGNSALKPADTLKAADTFVLLAGGEPGEYAPYEGDNLSLEVTQTDEGYTVTVLAEFDEPVKAEAFIVGYDKSRLSYSEFSNGDFFGPDGETFTTVIGKIPGHVAGVAALANSAGEPVSGNGCLAKLQFADCPSKQIADTKYHPGPAPEITDVDFDEPCDFLNYVEVEFDEVLPGDGNGDGYVDGKDLFIVAGYFDHDVRDYPCADLNGDGDIDGKDIFVIAAHYYEACQAYRLSLKELPEDVNFEPVDTITRNFTTWDVMDEDNCHPTGIIARQEYYPTDVWRRKDIEHAWPDNLYTMQASVDGQFGNYSKPVELEMDLGNSPWVVEWKLDTTQITNGMTITDAQQIMFVKFKDVAAVDEYDFKHRISLNGENYQGVMVEQSCSPPADIGYQIDVSDALQANHFDAYVMNINNPSSYDFDWSKYPDGEYQLRYDLWDIMGNQFTQTYDIEIDIDDRPVVDCIDPIIAVNGTAVTISGSNFENGPGDYAEVSLVPKSGAQIDQSISTQSATEIVFPVGSVSAGYYELKVTNPTSGASNEQGVNLIVVNTPTLDTDDDWGDHLVSVDNGDVVSNLSDAPNTFWVVDYEFDMIRAYTEDNEGDGDYEYDSSLSLSAANSQIQNIDFDLDGSGERHILNDINLDFYLNILTIAQGDWIYQYNYNYTPPTLLRSWSMASQFNPDWTSTHEIVDIADDYDSYAGRSTLTVLDNKNQLWFMDSSTPYPSLLNSSPIDAINSTQDTRNAQCQAIDMEPGSGDVWIIAYEPQTDVFDRKDFFNEIECDNNYSNTIDDYVDTQYNGNWEGMCMHSGNDTIAVITSPLGEPYNPHLGFIWSETNPKIWFFGPRNDTATAYPRGVCEIGFGGDDSRLDWMISRNNFSQIEEGQQSGDVRCFIWYDVGSGEDDDRFSGDGENPMFLLVDPADDPPMFPKNLLPSPGGITIDKQNLLRTAFCTETSVPQTVKWAESLDYAYLPDTRSATAAVSVTKYVGSASSSIFYLYDTASNCIYWEDADDPLTTFGSPFGSRPAGASYNVDIAWDPSVGTQPSVWVLYDNGSNSAYLRRYDNGTLYNGTTYPVSLSPNERAKGIDVDASGNVYLAIDDTSARSSRIAYYAIGTGLTSVTTSPANALSSARACDISLLNNLNLIAIADSGDKAIHLFSQGDATCSQSPGKFIVNFNSVSIEVPGRMDGIGPWPLEFHWIDDRTSSDPCVHVFSD